MSRRFTDDQKAIFEGVLNAQRAVYAMMRPGVLWTDCHGAAEREVLAALVKVGVLNGTVDQLAAVHMGATFFPHGLGHLIGCDTHDVGGYLDGTPARSTEPGKKKLRMARPLLPNMVVTVEPGCYFIDYLLDKALADPVLSVHINADVVARFRGFGGVRLEDVVVVTSDGPVNLTTCPRTVEEVESVMNGGAWPPATDAAPELCRKWGGLSADGKSMVVKPLSN